jgi:leucyl aminopeptidase
MAEQATKLARKTGMKVKVFRDDELVREKFEGLINVGKASENKPCMIRLEYAPKGGGKGKPIVLIGKTMTYDTGGLSLKVNNGMVGMKRDKDGGCAVLGAMHAIATVIKPNKRVVAYLTAAENSLSDEAYRPDDVLTYRNGVTVEVTNTDAEGRLVLADALCYTCEKDNPACIIDLATLTGGVVVALGSTYAGMFCEDDKLRAQVEAAATVSGERVWRLPMHNEYRDMMKSPVADIINSNPNRKAHPIQGAAFLSYFVKEGVPWCHLDIAGVHAVEKNAGMFIDGPTGWGVRLLAEMLDA